MATERLRRRIEQLLDEAEEAISQHNWEVVRGHAHSVLALDPENPDGLALLEAAKRAADNVEFSVADPPAPPIATQFSDQQPTSFANGRYQVKRLLGEGGKKKVYLAQDTLLDREVAFALIKTEGLAQGVGQGVGGPADTQFSLDRKEEHTETYVDRTVL